MKHLFCFRVLGIFCVIVAFAGCKRVNLVKPVQDIVGCDIEAPDADAVQVLEKDILYLLDGFDADVSALAEVVYAIPLEDIQGLEGKDVLGVIGSVIAVYDSTDYLRSAVSRSQHLYLSPSDVRVLARQTRKQLADIDFSVDALLEESECLLRKLRALKDVSTPEAEKVTRAIFNALVVKIERLEAGILDLQEFGNDAVDVFLFQMSGA